LSPGGVFDLHPAKAGQQGKAKLFRAAARSQPERTGLNIFLKKTVTKLKKHKDFDSIFL